MTLAVVVCLLGTLASLGAVGPDEAADLAAAARERAALRYDHALAWYAAAAATMPGDPTPACLSGEVYMLQEEWAKAVAAYRRCVALAPGRAAMWVALGDALAAQGDSPLAAWQRAADAGAPDGWRRLATAAENSGDFSAARRDWQRLPASDAEAQAHLGLIALAGGDYATARADFLAVLAHPGPFNDFLTQNRFVVLAALAPTDALGLGQVGYAFLAAGMPTFALAPLRAAVASVPSLGDAHAYLGWTLWTLGQTEAARSEIVLGARLAPYLSFAAFAAGEVALHDGALDTALADFQRGLQGDVRNPVLWEAVGQVALAQRDYLQAELALQNAAQLSTDPAYTVAFLRFYAEEAAGYRDERATLAANTAIERFPRSEPIRFLEAEIYNEVGQPSPAYYAAVAAEQLNPTDPAPHVFLGQFAEGTGNYVTAALELRTALALRPDGPLAPRARALLAPIADIAV
ncbi:MAG TPA: tetratricopeptide repeat protein [Ktedonobacterales bacterium]|nr:tetratricopeptide repeat protein [Ktedonobacterales bacterium]